MELAQVRRLEALAREAIEDLGERLQVVHGAADPAQHRPGERARPPPAGGQRRRGGVERQQPPQLDPQDAHDRGRRARQGGEGQGRGHLDGLCRGPLRERPGVDGMPCLRAEHRHVLAQLQPRAELGRGRLPLAERAWG